MNFKKIYSAFWTLSGSMLEYYDYMLFSYMMPIFSPILFPFAGKESLLSGYALIFAAAIFRPIGALLMGYVGDVIGRKYGLLLSVCLISLASLGMGLVPGYRSIGVWAIYIVFVLRIFQAMSAGGDLNGSAIFLIEHLGNKPGFASGIAWAATVLGMIMASIANYFAVQYQPNGWRYAFIIGALIGFVGMIMRANIIEGEGFKKKPKQDCSPRSIYPYLSVIAMGSGIGGMYYYIMVFSFHHMRSMHNWSVNLVLWHTICFILYGLFIILSGWISDYLNLKKIMKTFALILTSIAIPCFAMMPSYPILSSLVMVVIFAIFVGPSHNLTFNLFPPKYRYRSISTCYGIGTAFIGGATPYVCLNLLHINKILPAFWMIFCALMAYLSVVFAEKSPKIEYEND